MLVARYRDRLARYAVHMLGNREDAEEALQDAFVRAYRSLERCDDGARFGAWLYGILVNRCRTTGARAAKRGRVFVRDEAALNGVAHPSAAEQTEGEDVVRWALARLTPEYREAFLLKHVEDLEYEEMAQLTGAGVFGFVVVAPRAATVSLVGDFNDWDAARTPMQRTRTGESVWTAVIPLTPGRYRYAFLVDGVAWLADPTAPAARDDEFGAPSSVVTVGGS